MSGIDEAGHSRDINDDTDSLVLCNAHRTYIFPDDTDETVTFTAGGANNTFGAWAEVVDNNAVTLSSKIASDNGHISKVFVEAANTADKTYLAEIAYGAAKTIIAPYRFIAGDVNKLPAVQDATIRALHIPAGETVYYQMKCETGGATAQVHFRYHFHNGV